MSILGTFRTRSSSKRTSRDIARGLRTAPTRASRQELLLLQNRSPQHSSAGPATTRRPAPAVRVCDGSPTDG